MVLNLIIYLVACTTI